MEDTLISFETAKSAKEKGFTEGDHKTIYTELGNIMYDEDGYSPEVYLLAPSQNLLQKWLREVHKYHITINIKYDHSTESVSGFIIKIFNLNQQFPYIWYCDLHLLEDGLYQTYEEALEVGLQEALKLIK